LVDPLSTFSERPLGIPKGLTITPARAAAVLYDTLLGVPGLEVDILMPLPLPYVATARLIAPAVTWTRKARRAALQTPTSSRPAVQTEPVLTCTVFVKLEFDVDAEDDGRWTLVARWEHGREWSAFDTFSAHLVTKVSQRLSQSMTES